MCCFQTTAENQRIGFVIFSRINFVVGTVVAAVNQCSGVHRVRRVGCVTLILRGGCDFFYLTPRFDLVRVYQVGVDSLSRGVWGWMDTPPLARQCFQTLNCDMFKIVCFKESLLSIK